VYHLLDCDPLAQELLNAAIPVRLGYIGLDGAPRVVPIGFVYNGATFEMFTLPAAPKAAALRANPRVALTVDTEGQPPHVLMVRGTAAVELVDGTPDDYIDTGRRLLAKHDFAAWERQVRWMYDQMVRISVTPTWAKVFDFETRVPAAVEQVTREKGLMP
jgi:hypothetical protein